MSGAIGGTSHKRSASGNPRPGSRTAAPKDGVDEQHRRSEKVQVTTRETLLVTRTRSPERRSDRDRERERERVARQKERERERARDARTAAPAEPQQQPTVVPWNGEVYLVPHTTAPLASRVSIPPSAADVAASRDPKPLHEMTLEAQEAVILEDMLFALMGCEGQYIRFTRTYHATDERERLSGPDFRILPGLDPSLQDLAMSMLKMAKHYCALEAFVDVLSRDEYGAVNHALCASVRRYLQDYLVMMAQLETQFLTDDAFTLHVLNMHTLPTSRIMFQLYSLAHELSKRNSLLDDESSDDESSGGDEDDYENILQQLRDGIDASARGGVGTKKICKGGAVLGLITRLLETMSGDPAARALLTTLLRDASRPYMRMLNEWLHRGGIDDPHAEFLVKELRSIRREIIEEDYTDEYWERRYTIRELDVPPQLEPVRDKVLLAGKYLNVVRECGGVDVSKEVRDVPQTFDDPRFLENVNAAYAHANESLMRLLLTTHALPARLQSLKHYFFLDPSDYFSYFLELGASELRKPVRTVNTAKLQSLLDLVLRQPGSAVSLDPFKDAVKVEMNEVGLTAALQRVVRITGADQGDTLPAVAAAANTAPAVEADRSAIGFSSLQLDYAVPFPVSLVVSRKTIWRYQVLFRYLLSLRHLESQLSTTWQTHARSLVWAHRSTTRTQIETWKRRVWTLRARMLVFVQQLLYFCTAEVIEKNWQAFMARVRDSSAAKTRTVDELINDHVDFLNSCLRECMLTNSKLLRVCN